MKPGEIADRMNACKYQASQEHPCQHKIEKDYQSLASDSEMFQIKPTPPSNN
jgi:hypothetical protein